MAAIPAAPTTPSAAGNSPIGGANAMRPAMCGASGGGGGGPMGMGLAAGGGAVPPTGQMAMMQQQMAPKQQVQVQVPAGAMPGSQFQINVGGKLHTIQVPQGAMPGQMLTVSV